MYADNNKNKEAKKYNGSDSEITKLDSKNRTEVDAVIEEVKRELRSVFVKTDEQIKRLGNALKKVVKREESICEEIKNALKEEIAEGIISTRTIELHCASEWKHKTKPKQRENEKISFSKVEEKTQQQQIAVTQDGKSVIINETPSNTDTVSSDVNNRLHEESNQNGFAQSKEESSIKPSIAFPIKQQTKVLRDTKKQVFVSHIPMPFVPLQRDMANVFKITKGAGNIFWQVWVDLETS
ncbi:MAG: hypothetical protein WBZ36_11005, partial [Candidatus Nitrosopolaris sp.]